jgi:hypothetical protein
VLEGLPHFPVLYIYLASSPPLLSQHRNDDQSYNPRTKNHLPSSVLAGAT